MGGQHTALAVSSWLALLLAIGCGGRTHPEADASRDLPDSGQDSGACGDCNDGVSCTRDSCIAGRCAHEPDDAICASESPCRVPSCDALAGCSVEPQPDGTWCGATGADGAPPPVCDAGDCLPQRVVGVVSWATMRVEALDPTPAYGYYSYVARVTDRDGDGIDDVAAHVRHDDERGVQDRPGGVGLYSFPSGRTIWQIEPAPAEMNVGRDLRTVGDLDGDGASDLVFTLERDGLRCVRAVEATRGGALWERGYEAEWLSVSVVGDKDGDGSDDLAVAVGRSGEPSSLEILSGVLGDGLALVEVDGDSDSYYGVMPFGDVDGDGVADIVTGIQSADLRSGLIQTLSGDDLSLLATYSPTRHYSSVKIVMDDLTRDGLPEVIVYEWDPDESGGPAAVDLSTGAHLWTLPFESWTDRRTYDVDADSHTDFTGTDWTDRDGARTWRSGATGELLFQAASVDETGSPVAPLGTSLQMPDLNGDGAEDWLVPYRNERGAFLLLASICQGR